MQYKFQGKTSCQMTDKVSIAAKPQMPGIVYTTSVYLFLYSLAEMMR